MADRIAVFSEGRIVQVGGPQELYSRPRTRFVADFVGGSNVLPPEFAERLGGPRAWASLRPEHVRIGDGPLRGRVTAVRYLGAATRVTVDAGEADIVALVPGGRAPAEGETVGLIFDPDALHSMEEA
jgi:putative spermidine/putrescine transport system ATP-binding protein